MRFLLAPVLAVSVFAIAMPFSAILLTSATAHAQVPDAGVAPGDTGRETEFVAMTGPARESVPGGALLVSAYAIIWLILCGYVGRLALLQSSTSKELVRLEKALRERGDGDVAESKKAEKGK